MPLESALNTVTSQTGVLLVRVVDDSAGTPDSANMTPANVILVAGIVSDTSPQLGGDLDVNGNDITSPDGTDLIDIVNGTITIQTASTSRLDITDSGVRLGGANARVTTVLDEDAMGSDSATALATQQSIKAYADTMLPLAGGTMTGTIDAGGYNIEDAGAIEYEGNTVGASGATETLDTSLNVVHDITMDEACTFTFSNPAASGNATVFTLILRGAFTPTFPASVDWGDGSAPTYTTPSVYTFTTVDAGTTWLGAQVGKAFA